MAEDLRGAEAVAGVIDVARTPLPRPRLAWPGRADRGPPASTSLEALAPSLAALDEADRRALLERLPVVPGLLAADGRAMVVVVELAFSSDDVMRTRAVVDGALGERIAAHDAALAEVGLRRELAGIPAIRAAFSALVFHDQAIFVPAMLALIGLALLVMFRRVHAVVIPAVAAGAPLLALVGIMGWLGEPIGLLNQAYFTLLPVIAVADAIHLVARVHEERRAGRGREEAIVQASAQVGLACTLTTLTTAAGFASLAVAEAPILRGFGLFAALGVVLAFAVVTSLVPLLLSFVGEEASRGAALPGPAVGEACVRLACARPKLVLVAAGLLGAAALVPASRVQVDNRLGDLLEAEHPVSRASDEVDASLGGVLGLEVEWLAGSPELDLREPAVLAKAARFEAWLAARPEVREVRGPGSAVARAGELIGEPAEVPATRTGVDARLDALAGFAPLDTMLAPSGRALRIHAGMPDAGGRDFVAFAAEAEAELARILGPEYDQLDLREQLEARTTGTALMAYRGVNRITDDLRRSFALVFAVVVVVIALLLRSPWALPLGLVPNLLPLVFGYAAVGLSASGLLDPLAAVILTLGLGVAVDDTLHILVRTREALAEEASLEAALRQAMAHTGRAVTWTSVILAGGLALNLGSSFPPLQMLGLLGATVIALALVVDLLVLPALVMVLGGRGLVRRRERPRA
nr:MMPL family transporter [Pseudenhygromyxa sp. WMMC2535]